MKNKILAISVVAILIIGLLTLAGCGSTENNNNMQNIESATENQKIETTTGKVTSEYYGDYINYGIDLNGDGDTTNDWKIFYNDGTYTYIIPSNSILLNKVPDISGLQKLSDNSNYLAYFEHSYLTGEMQELQGNSQERFMLGDYKLEANKESSKTVSILLNTENWTAFVNEYADYAIGGPTLQMWIASWNEKYNENIEIRVAENGYEVKLDGTANWSAAIDMKDKEGYTNELYFPKFTDASGNTRCNYWLSSQGQQAGSALPTADIYQITDGEGQSIYATYSGVGGGFRPVVSLKANQNLVKENGVWNIVK